MKEDVMDHGVTQGCGGCRYYRTGVKQQHTGKCKERFRNLLGGKARVRLDAAKKAKRIRRREE